MLGYSRALKAIRQIVQLAGDTLKDLGLRSLRIGGATAMAAGGEISDIIRQMETGMDQVHCSSSLRNNLEDAGAVSSKLAQGGVR